MSRIRRKEKLKCPFLWNSLYKLLTGSCDSERDSAGLCINSRNVPPICRICDFEFEFECVRGILVRELPCVLPFFSFCVSELGDLTQQFRDVSCTFFPPSPPPPPTNRQRRYELRQKRVQNQHRVWKPRKESGDVCGALSCSIGTWISRGVPKPRYFADFFGDDMVWKLANWILRSTSYGLGLRRAR